MTHPQPDDVVSQARAAAETALAWWHADHPTATLAEIERAVDAHLSGYRAAVIQEIADDAPQERPVCPDCGAALVRTGNRTRRLRTAQDGEVRFTEAGWRCAACGAGFFPPQ